MSRRNLICLALAVVLGGALLFTACNKDRTPPTVAITTPANDSVLMGYIPIQARAYDNKDVPVVEFYVDDAFKGVDSLGSDSVYSFVWDATAEAIGSQHQLTAKAFDRSGNSATSAAVTITIGISSGPTSHRGNISYPETWDPIGNPHIVTGNLTVNSFLTLKPGVEIRVDPGFFFKIGAAGGLLARGTTGDPILITSHAAQPARGDWQGLQVGAGANGDSVVLEHCTIEYGGKDTLHSVLEMLCSPATLWYCTIRNGAGYGIWSPTNNIGTFWGNTVTGNHGYALHVDSRYAGFIVNSNDLSGNGKGIEVVGGVVEHDATWHDAKAPYVLTTNLTVGNQTAVTLTIGENATLRFRPGKGINVGMDSSHIGGLIVHGRLTSDSSFPHAGDWNGIHFGYLTRFGWAILDGCTLDYAGGNGAAAVVTDSVPIEIKTSTIRYSSNFGVRANRTGFAAFTGNDISLCAQYPVSIDPDFVATVGNNQLDQGLFVAPGYVTLNASWVNHGFPYVIGGAVEVGGPQTPLLSIQDAQVQFAAGAALRVGTLGAGPGALDCGGVRFTGVNQQPGAWKGIEFREQTNSATSRVVNSFVNYGGGDTLGNIVCIGAAPSITGDSITNSAACGIYLNNSTLNPDTLLAHNQFGGNLGPDVGP
jgi:hypothetical protein